MPALGHYISVAVQTGITAAVLGYSMTYFLCFMHLASKRSKQDSIVHY